MTDYDTDYELPADWHARDPEQKDAWFHAERSRRRAAAQADAQAQHTTVDELRRIAERWDRRVGARSETVDLSNYR